ncbi:MAG TPA: ABC transporter ATP-binding protein [Actinomycetota bacterium]|nr:ABC transporter ATP-binding protein [Actinomycetota bacterium]
MSGHLALRAENLVKDYGKIRALSGVSLAVEPGEVFGFIGPNGAGKSTTIRILLDLLRPTSGLVEVFGQNPRAGGPELRRRIGYLPGELVLPGKRKAGDYLAHLARLRGGAGGDLIEPLAKRFGLDLAKPIKSLSKGNKQKVGLVQAFMHRPELLILDEPSSGLDPLLQQEFLAMVKQASAQGSTIFMSSHVLSEVEEIAARVGILRSGRMVDVDSIDELRRRAGQEVELRFAAPVTAGEFTCLDGVSDVVVADSQVRLVLRGEPNALLKTAARHHVVGWSAENRDLEELFLDFYRTEEVNTDGN